jgi:hypothetical protein
VDGKDLVTGVDRLPVKGLREGHGTDEILRKAAFQRGGEGFGMRAGESADCGFGLRRGGRGQQGTHERSTRK